VQSERIGSLCQELQLPMIAEQHGPIAIARQSTWQVRVKQDGKGSRGIWIMALMIVAGKRYVES
jgi:hypothetical protein